MATAAASSQANPRPAWLPEAEYPFSSRFVDIEGNRIHYVDEGAGPALLLVNVGMWSFIFRDLITELRDEFRCIALDFPGLGLSGAASNFEPTVSANSRILELFVEALDLQDITLLVHDMGGPVGLGFAARHSDRIRALIVAQSFAWPLSENEGVRRMLRLVSGRLFHAINAWTNALIAFTKSRYGVGRHLSAEGRRAFAGPWRTRAARHMTLRVLGGAVDTDEWMANIEEATKTTLNQLPILTVYGAWNDPYHWQQRLHRTFPRARGLTVPRGMHFPFMDDPKLVAASIRKWWIEDVNAGRERRTFRGISSHSESGGLT